MTAARSAFRPARGVLVVVAAMLAASGALRIGHGAGQALARSAEPGPVAEASATSCPPPPDALAHALSAREAALAAREATLEDRIAALALAEEVTARRLSDLAVAEENLRSTLSLADGAAEADLQRLTAVYETMKPKDASALFGAMDPAFAAGFLGRMRPDAAAAVLAGMEPAAAYAISALIAGRNARAPSE
ncbi:MAG TPA: hypothetical protein PKD10_15885 [Paracoccaceae bacterium]|nr:hypothetical protein [Paracoccaceae bacterium]HMO72961.1 hypothetical protein [Paracoccaceae bacterium]